MTITKDFDVIDKHGKRVRRSGILEDGDRMTVKMTMMDAEALPLAQQLQGDQREAFIQAVVNGTPLLDAIEKAKAVRRAEQFDARGHRPGYVQDSSGAAHAAREARDQRMRDAWKNPPSVQNNDATATEQVAIVGASAPIEQLHAAREAARFNRDKRLENAWQR